MITVRNFGICILACAAALVSFVASARADTAPPRSIADITAVLDREKPDPARQAQLKQDAELQPPAGLKGPPLAEFLYKRAQARALIGRNADAITDAQAAVQEGKDGDYIKATSRYEQFLINQYRLVGDFKHAIDLINTQIRFFSNQSKGRLFGLNQTLVIIYLTMGDANRAETYVQKNRALFAETKTWPNNDMYRSTYLSSIESGNARLLEARGRFAEAEDSYRKQADYLRDSMQQMAKWPSAPPRETFESGLDFNLAFLGRVKTKQGKLAEGEADVRQALLSRLGHVGKYHVDTANMLGVFAWVLMEQARYQEAEQLARAEIDIFKSIGYADDTGGVVSARGLLAQSLNSQRRFDEATAVFDVIDKSTANWDAARREGATNSLSRASALLAGGDPALALEVSKKYYEREKARSGEGSFFTALARGFMAVSLANAKRDAEALAEYKAALPILTSGQGNNADEDRTTAVARETRMRFVVEGYVGLLSRHPELAGGDVGEETFKFADVLRGHAVERALAASRARAAAKDPAMADAVRNAQDLKKGVSGALQLLNDLLALPSGDQDTASIKAVQADIARQQAALTAANKDIAKRFPDYANLIDPPPPASADIKSLLRSDEVLLSFYFGRFASFVWAVTKDRPIQFARLSITQAQLETKVAKLRAALEPEAAMISDIPPFDLTLAYELYTTLLKPVEAGWKPAKNLIVTTNSALGLLPLSLLPTAPAEAKTGDAPLFSSYRAVPWLARSHAVTLVPSAASLVTLRRLPPGKANRDKLIGFGDPLFNADEAREAAAEQPVQVADASATMRGVPLKRRSSPHVDDEASVNLGMLPRLPDTADELKSIALALEADPTKALNLGKDANEQKVKTTDLSKFKIVAFATHGLVPGELDGLTQPALALTAPDVADVDGDGLLTMEEILGLKLDADWVVLSACNTGTGAGAGAEAFSGLGRAFFYAGTRALLVTNWSVHSQSARELVTDLFRRQAADPTLTRGEALRQAMVALMDGDGFKDDGGKTVFTYAHPLFWAPYTIIGDGG